MIGVTKTLDDFNHNVSQPFLVNSTLSNIIITNRSTTESIFVTIPLSLPEYSAVSEIIKNMEIPPSVSLQLLENSPLKVRSSKCVISYTCTSTDNNLMSVTYTSS